MSVTSATVETLTAEVRVLMVGSRQVTLSVAKQLDRIHVTDLDPFGRVELGLLQDNPDDDPFVGKRTRVPAHFVVGRDRRSGALALAQYFTPRELHLRYCDRHPRGEHDYDQEMGATHAAMAALPLIVLAGLR